MKKKILALALVVAMLAISVVSGTLAYFTDQDADLENVFTFGEVDIKLIESQYTIGVDNANDDTVRNDNETFQNEFSDKNNLLVPTDYVAKNPYIENVGTVDAYVFFRVIVSNEILDLITIDWNDYYEIIQAEPFGANGEYTNFLVLNKEDARLQPNDVADEPVFYGFTVDKDVTIFDAESVDFEGAITVSAFALQADGFDNFKDAFNTAYVADGAWFGTYGETGIIA